METLIQILSSVGSILELGYNFRFEHVIAALFAIASLFFASILITKGTGNEKADGLAIASIVVVMPVVVAILAFS